MIWFLISQGKSPIAYGDEENIIQQDTPLLRRSVSLGKGII